MKLYCTSILKEWESLLVYNLLSKSCTTADTVQFWSLQWVYLISQVFTAGLLGKWSVTRNDDTDDKQDRKGLTDPTTMNVGEDRSLGEG